MVVTATVFLHGGMLVHVGVQQTKNRGDVY